MHLSKTLERRLEDYLIEPVIEKPWVEMQPFLLKRGYRLRPRYDPDWTPSWFQVQVGENRLHPEQFEDSQYSGYSLLDAVRVSDDQKVFFKRVQTNTDEIPIAIYLSSQENREDSRNHAVPVLDIIMIPGTDDKALLVMPFLLRFHLLPFRFLGEFCEFAMQILEVWNYTLEFMHEHNIAHRDACWNNLMMDATKVVPKGHHFCRWNTHDGVREDSFQWNTRCASKDILVIGRVGQDKTAPELSEKISYNPFRLDVYQAGNVLKECIKEYKGLEAFSDLADAMTRNQPEKRPTMSESLEMCKTVIASVAKSRNLKFRVWRRKSLVTLSGVDKLAIMLGWLNPIN